MKKFVFGLLFIAIFGLTGQVLATGEVVPPPAGQPDPINLYYAPPCLLPTQLGECPETVSSITDYLLRLYNFAVGIVGILALGMIVVGAIMVSVSGAVDKKREGMDMIKSAIWGIVLLLGSYLILNTINPALTKLKEPGLPTVTLPQYNFEIELGNVLQNPNFISCSAGQTQLNNCISSDKWLFAIVDKDNQNTILTDQGSDSNGYECKNTNEAIPLRVGERGLYRPCQPQNINQLNANRGFVCNFLAEGTNQFKEKCQTAECQNCSQTNDLPVKTNQNCQFAGGQLTNCVCTWTSQNLNNSSQPACFINTEVKNQLDQLSRAMAQNNINWQITEAYPPTVLHSSDCHFNGRCIDVALISTQTCQNIKTLAESAKDVGFDKVIIEYNISPLKLSELAQVNNYNNDEANACDVITNYGTDGVLRYIPNPGTKTGNNIHLEE